jgi:hypothetical protein
MSSRKLVIVGTLAFAAALAAGAVQARDRNDVQWSVTIGAPLYSQPYPVHSQPYAVYSQPYPAYPQRQYHARGYQQPTRWDRDGDGIPNRHDPVYNPRWDRDGDGIPNRHDRDDHARHDRDGDGIPNWQDRNDSRPWRGR